MVHNGQSPNKTYEDTTPVKMFTDHFSIVNRRFSDITYWYSPSKTQILGSPETTQRNKSKMVCEDYTKEQRQ